jgi:hypothetical protein
MNIYELEKRATPGLVTKQNIGSRYDCSFNSDNKPDAASYNSQLDRHKINNFMRALKALKKCRNHLSGDPAFGACPIGLDELIAELEEVR